ncbi:MAG: PorT family protein [Bacteroidales bacterium]|nr:PorT family protein [Bacteroidales bacterium]
MRKIIIFILFLITLFSVSAQEKRWENNFYLGQGFILDYKDGEGEEGVSIVAGYGLSYRMSPHWSVMPGVAYRSVIEGALYEYFDGYDYDSFSFLDVPFLVRYHTGVGKRYFTFGFGPVLSFCTNNDTYYMDADPRSPLNNLNKCKTFSLGLQPTASYQFARHFSVGIDGYICLTNLKQHHGLSSGGIHIHSLTFRMAYNF